MHVPYSAQYINIKETVFSQLKVYYRIYGKCIGFEIQLKYLNWAKKIVSGRTERDKFVSW